MTVAVVRDGPTPAQDVAALVEAELKELLPGTAITFVASPDFDAGKGLAPRGWPPSDGGSM